MVYRPAMRRIASLFVAVSTAATALTSGLVTQSAQAAATDVVINEILYHPEDDHPDGEFIELYNRGGSAVDLSGWCIDGVRYCFPSGTVVGAQQFLVTSSAVWEGRLSNGGEELALLDVAGDQIDFVEYDDKKQWPANTDGEGASLQRLDVDSDADDPGNWWGAAPTLGSTNAVISAPRAVWDDVEHTKLPAPGEPIVIEAEVEGALNAQLQYLIDFGNVTTVTAPIVDGKVEISIPGQAAGSLVRYRLIAYNDEAKSSTWPRQGDGATYTGTTVASTNTSALARFEWFMPDDEYEIARNDLTLRGDDGYSAVFAHDGEIFDNTKVRVKGQTSRFWPKKKWKFILPAGHELEIDGVFPEAVDEFALHSSWSDKSFLREVLSAEFMDAAGLPVSQAFPVQLERNQRFFGLYTYVEQRDGTFRDRQNFGDATVYEVGGNDLFGSMAPRDANASQELLRRRYDKDTNEFENDDALRELIVAVNAPPAQRRAYIDRFVDKGSVINTIAASAVIQHHDFGDKNYDLILSDQGLWQITPTDFDLTYGHRGAIPCGSLCDPVFAGGAFEHPGTPLFEAFWFDPELSALIRQRIRTLTEDLLDADVVGPRIAELRDLIAPTAAADRQRWGTFGAQQSPADAANQIMTSFVIPQERRILGTLTQQGRVAATSEPVAPNLTITSVQYDEGGGRPAHLIVRNDSNQRVDIGGYEIESIDLEFTGATFLNPGASAVAVHEDSGSIVDVFPCCVLGGVFHDDLDDADDGLTLTNRDGTTISSWLLVAPGQYTEFEGRPGESAFVSVVAVNARGRGYLQVLDCEAEAGATANLTHDTDGQVRAGAAIVRFDADGKLCVYNSSATEIVIDIQGYVADAGIDDVDDDRLLDTRTTSQPTAGSVTTISGRPDSSAVVSLSAVRATGRGFIQVLPCDATPGETANLNLDRPDQNRTGLAVIDFDAAGQACVYTSVSTHLVVDLQAYLADSAVDDIADQRLVDTRAAQRPASGSQTTISGEPGASAIVSVVAVQTTGRGYVQILPCGATPGASANLNASGVDQNVSNLAVVQFDASGTACVFVETASHLVVDLQAYFELGAFDDITDDRALDTR